MYFSIIIPTYNRADLIEKTLKSVFDQKYNKFEIIIVDNCSTDNTKEVLLPFIESKKIKFIEHQSNFERSKSRNTGMDHATGDYVTFLDSDDLMGESCLSDMAEFLTRTKSTSNIVFNRHSYVDEKGLKIPYFQPRVDLNNPFKQILIGNFLACIGVFISKKIYEKFRFNEDSVIIGSEDWLYWIEILNSEKSIAMIDKVNCFIVDHENRTMKQFNPKALENRVEFIYGILKSKLNLSSQELKIFYWSSRILVANGYFEAGDRAKAFKMVLKSVIKYPILFFNLRMLILMKNIFFKIK
ncbi:MAG: glycosyltransferase family 2 protein [Bacteroidota bacterium]